MKFPVKETIISGDWLQCSTDTSDGEFHFRLRPISFKKAVISDIDERFRMNFEEGVLWLLKIEVVNLNRTLINAEHVLDRVALLDQDDFIFETTKDHNLILWSDFAELVGLKRFTSITPLAPKVKSIGTLAFQLPDDEQAEYFISLTEGNVQAV